MGSSISMELILGEGGGGGAKGGVFGGTQFVLQKAESRSRASREQGQEKGEWRERDT